MAVPPRMRYGEIRFYRLFSKDDSLRSGGRYPAQARFPGPKTCQGFALKQNRVPHGFLRNEFAFQESIFKEVLTWAGKLSLEGAKPAIGFENYIRFIYVRRCRAERRKGILNALQKFACR
ncbi:hypothetical protein TNCV_2012411 [Trichonephila clavipes]|nr:hypothetical protein TNCV_2012411 [Trichonephila clavipes]